MVLGKVNKGINKTSSVHPYESAWLGRWTHDIESKGYKDLVKPENIHQSFHNEVGSSSKPMAYGMPWMYAQQENSPIQEKTTQNFLDLIRPVRICATVDSVKLPKEDGQRLLNVPTVSMKLKGKVFGDYLDLFPEQDQFRNNGVRLQSLESPKDIKDESRKNESSAETDTLEIDRVQTIHLAGSISSSSIKGKGRIGDSGIPWTEIPDMNEEPPLVPDRENSVDETSNSATQSMNVEHFLSRECKRVRLEPEAEPSSRWLKRLKTYDEPKILMETKEASMEQKGNNNLFLEILKSGINNLQPRNQEPITSQINNLKQGGDDITLLHPWIQRWCKKKSTEQPGEEDVSVEPDSHQKELEKKQYPSIAAMALMGKALSGLNPHGLRKTNSLMVWNARDLR